MEKREKGIFCSFMRFIRKEGTQDNVNYSKDTFDSKQVDNSSYVEFTSLNEPQTILKEQMQTDSWDNKPYNLVNENVTVVILNNYPPSKIEKGGMRFLMNRRIWEIYRNNISFLLKKADIYTIGDLISRKRAEITNIEKVGERTISTIESFMTDFGLKWEMQPKRYEDSEPLDPEGDRGPEEDRAGLKFLLSRHVWEVFPQIISKKLVSSGYIKIADLLYIERRVFIQKPGIGTKTIAFIDDFIKEYGLQWGIDVNKYVRDERQNKWVMFNSYSNKHIKRPINIKGRSVYMRKK